MDRLSKFVHREHIDEKGKKAFGFSHTALIMFGPYIATFILFIMHFAVGDVFTNEAYHWVMFAVFVPLIGISLILTQKWSLVGAYGETILLLIPTFVWLLGGSYEAIWITIMIAFIFAMIGIVLYFVAYTMIRMKTNDEVAKRRLKISSMILFRVAFMFSSVVSTIIISVIVLNWADFSMNFGNHYVNDVTGARAIEGTSTSWIVFIAVVTIITAVSLVMLGLIISFQSAYKMQHNKSVSESLKLTMTKMFSVDHLKRDRTKTTIIKNPKEKWYKFK